MSDPRGHDFNRGRGKWHTPRPQSVTPADYGWRLTGWNDKYQLSIWTIGALNLMRHPIVAGWLTWPEGSETADEWQGGLEEITATVLADYDEGRCVGCGVALSEAEAGRCVECVPGEVGNG